MIDYDAIIQGNYGKPEYDLPKEYKCKMCGRNITITRHLCDACYELKLDEEMKNDKLKKRLGV